MRQSSFRSVGPVRGRVGERVPGLFSTVWSGASGQGLGPSRLTVTALPVGITLPEITFAFLFLPSRRAQAFPSCLPTALILQGPGIFQARPLWPEGTDSWPRHLFSTTPPPNWEHSQKTPGASWETRGSGPQTLLVFSLLTCCVTLGRSASLSEPPQLIPAVR